MPKGDKIVVTGIAGRIGRVIQRFLGESWRLFGVDLHPVTHVPSLVADITCEDVLVPLYRGAYAVIHLAACAKWTASWNEVIRPNILGTQAVFEAARVAGVHKVIFASSNHVTGLYEKDEPYKSIVEGRYAGLNPADIPKITHTMPIRPDGPYGVSKAFGEIVGRYYADAFGMQVLCLRFGTVNDQNRPTNQREYATLLTHRDLVTLLETCLQAESILFDIFYGVSENTWRFWDITHVQEAIGWTPRDTTETFR